MAATKIFRRQTDEEILDVRNTFRHWDHNLQTCPARKVDGQTFCKRTTDQSVEWFYKRIYVANDLLVLQKCHVLQIFWFCSFNKKIATVPWITLPSFIHSFIFNPKIYVADFGSLKRAFFGSFPKKKLLHNFPNMRGGVKARLEYFRKFIRFGSATRP